MNTAMKTLAFCALIGASGSAIAAPVLFPNGDFEIPGGSQWGQSFGGNQVISYPASGGNGGGYASIVSNEAGGYAVLISNNDQPYPLSSLGLVAGNTYTFSYDMITSVAGANKGGIKLESWTATAAISNSGDQRVTSASTGWSTYTYTYTIAPTATHIKIVPLWTPNQTVGFDNIKVDNTAIVPPPVVPVVPNGNFEIAGGASWAFFQGGGQTVSYPASGGNPNGCAIIDSASKGAYAVMVANNNAPMTLASLGLTAGKTYTFQQDMKILAGTNIGGVKVEFVPTGTGDLYPTKIGDGTSWATYSFQITIPLACTQLMVVPLWGPDSTVAYDNFKILLPAPPGAPKSSIATGNILSWTAASTENSYQPQQSDDNTTWVDVGAPLTGNAVNSRFSLGKSAFYQVVERTPDLLANGVPNPGFEISDTPSATNPGAMDWNIPVAPDANAIMSVVSSYTGGYTPRSGSAMLLIEGITPATGQVTPPNTNVRSNSITPVIGGSTYTLSFYASNPVKVGGANPQYYLEFFDDFNVFISNSFTSFASAGSTWTLFEKTFTAPAGAASVKVGFIQAMGAGNGWDWVTLIDDLSLPVPSTPGASSVIAATATPAVQVTWDTLSGSSYQVKSSPDLSTWTNFGTSINGNGSPFTVVDTISGAKKFYRVLQSTP